MDPQQFVQDLNTSAALFVAKLYDFSDLPRNRVNEITNGVTEILQCQSIKNLLNQLLDRLKHLGESSDNISVYTMMLDALLNPFNLFSTETLYKAEDLKHVSLEIMLSHAVEELKFLESDGITITTSSGQTQIYFSLVGVIGDNLAIHSMLGFISCFSSHHPCRFCSINRQEINTIFTESLCDLRTSETYHQDLMKNKPSETGIARQSVLSKIESSTAIDLLTVDVMHDILEGTAEYDLGLILNYFITTAKFFTLDELNNRIESLYYGDEARNKPRTLKKAQINEKYVKMSAAEALCLIKNIGVLIGHFIPRNDPYWKLCILLKEIIDIVTSTVIHFDLCDYLENLISEYLRSLTLLFPGCLKPKHHFLLHYARIMRLMGPAWNLNTMRGESKNKESKITARASVSRKNICKTLAVKHQLHLSYRFLLNSSPMDLAMHIL
ncbi:uncharacterized protein LOC130673922 [Microplitis mediator]|uniref:uncharacterized protein LOC130673922 n=1 Tax=Microplitis mediator TaxID=375433 RepID=UPI002556AA72|nr:uncharacterized protein LOC130673922 [Microplitis mediator]